MNRSGGTVNIAATGRPHVVRIDIETDAGLPLDIDAEIRRDTAERLRQHHRSAAVQNPHRLYRARIHRHPPAYEVLAQLDELDPQVAHQGVSRIRLQIFEGRADKP